MPPGGHVTVPAERIELASSHSLIYKSDNKRDEFNRNTRILKIIFYGGGITKTG
jgi:hypothetical protein